MTRPSYQQLSRREREIMDVIYRRRKATASAVHASLASPPSYSAVRATLRILEEKGFVRHKREGQRYVFFPTVSRTKERRRALGQVLKTFFDGSTEQALAALLDLSKKDLTKEELNRLTKLIEDARKEGR
jgi:predicted transcriptional regulator